MIGVLAPRCMAFTLFRWLIEPAPALSQLGKQRNDRLGAR
jgi:hypothetical protein